MSIRNLNKQHGNAYWIKWKYMYSLLSICAVCTEPKMTFGYSSMPVPPLDYLPITELHRQSSCIHPCMRKYGNMQIFGYDSGLWVRQQFARSWHYWWLYCMLLVHLLTPYHWTPSLLRVMISSFAQFASNKRNRRHIERVVLCAMMWVWWQRRRNIHDNVWSMVKQKSNGVEQVLQQFSICRRKS